MIKDAFFNALKSIKVLEYLDKGFEIFESHILAEDELKQYYDNKGRYTGKIPVTLHTKEKDITKMAQKIGKKLAFEMVNLLNYPVNWREVKEIKEEVLNEVESYNYSQCEKDGIITGIKSYFAEYDSLLRDYFRDVV